MSTVEQDLRDHDRRESFLEGVVARHEEQARIELADELTSGEDVGEVMADCRNDDEYVDALEHLYLTVAAAGRGDGSDALKLYKAMELVRVILTVKAKDTISEDDVAKRALELGGVS